MAVTMKGLDGDLRVGYRVVATFGSWTVTGDRLDAPDATLDAYWHAQPIPKRVRLRVGRQDWVWEVEVLSHAPLSVRLVGSPEVRGA